MAKQPFYHRIEVLFTASSDVSDEINKEDFKRRLEKWLNKELGGVKKGSLEFDCIPDAEAGDPADW